jgi:hypothetical protein
MLGIGALLLCLSGLFPPWRDPPAAGGMGYRHELRTEDYHFFFTHDAARLIPEDSSPNR